MKTSVYIATSLDGFIARPDGAIDWLPGIESEDGEDYGYKAFMDTVDALIMGRNTFEKVLTLGDWTYGSKPVVVLTNRPIEIPPSIAGSVESMSASPVEIVEQLTKRGVHHLYIDGGKTIQGFLEAKLLNRLIITQIPVLIGSGIPLFGPLPHDYKLQHIQTRSFPNGFVQSEYQIL